VLSGKTGKYSTVALPIAMLEAIDSLIDGLGYWPSRAAFTREACMEKLEKHRRELRERELRVPGSDGARRRE